MTRFQEQSFSDSPYWSGKGAARPSKPGKLVDLKDAVNLSSFQIKALKSSLLQALDPSTSKTEKGSPSYLVRELSTDVILFAKREEGVTQVSTLTYAVYNFSSGNFLHAGQIQSEMNGSASEKKRVSAFGSKISNNQLRRAAIGIDLLDKLTLADPASIKFSSLSKKDDKNDAAFAQKVRSVIGDALLKQSL